MVGAMYAKGYVNDLQEATSFADMTNNPVVATLIDKSGITDGATLNDLSEKASRTGATVATLATNYLTDMLNDYIWHRVAWAMGSILVAIIVLMLIDHRTSTTRRPVRRRSTPAARKNYDDF